MPKTAVTPTVIIKQEDWEPLRRWQDEHQKPIHVWHVFFDKAFGLAFDEAERLVREGLILPTVESPDYFSVKQSAFCFYYHYAYLLGEFMEAPQFEADMLHWKNGQLLPYNRITGGKLSLSDEALGLLFQGSNSI